MQIASDGETGSFVDADGGGIIQSDAEDGRFAAREYALRDCRHEGLCVPASPVFGIGADCADLRESRNPEALSGHGDETAGVANALIAAEFDGAAAKRAGFGGLGELSHFKNVRVAKWFYD